MKFFWLFVTLSFVWTFSQTANAQKMDSITSMTILNMRLMNDTRTPVMCEGFSDRDWPESFKHSVTDKSVQNRIANLIKSAKPTSPKPDWEINTRGKITIQYSSGKLDVICLGATRVILLNNKPMELKNHSLQAIIWKLNYPNSEGSPFDN